MGRDRSNTQIALRKVGDDGGGRVGGVIVVHQNLGYGLCDRREKTSREIGFFIAGGNQNRKVKEICGEGTPNPRPKEDVCKRNEQERKGEPEDQAVKTKSLVLTSPTMESIAQISA